METAATANIVLSAIEGEPCAALRALRYSAAMEIDPQERFVACWVESAGLHAWFVGEDGVENEVRYPAPEYSSATESLTDLAGDDPDVQWIYIGGDIDLLDRAGVSAIRRAVRRETAASAALRKENRNPRVPGDRAGRAGQ